jgi:hypothetical protein
MVESANDRTELTTDHPIDKGNLYKDGASGLFVKIDGFFIDEDGRTQVKIRQYTDRPIAAHVSAAYTDEYDPKRTIDSGTLHGRVAIGELQLVDTAV